MSVIKVPTSFNIDLEFEVPEFYRRMIALLMDWVLMYFYLKIANEIFLAIIRRSDMDMDSLYNLTAWAFILQLPIIIYHPLMEITMNGQSIGKKIMGLRVVNENGGRPGISQFMIRWLVRDVWFIFLFRAVASDEGYNPETIFMLTITIVYFITEIVLVVSTKKGQRIGDILAHTIIIRTKQQRNIEDTVFQEVVSNYIPSFPQIMRLSDKDINAIKSILETARKKGDYNMAANASDKIRTHLDIKTSLSPFEFLDVLLKDYNYLSIK
jgi:uncharacterized RDD family membrane protein YckC